MMIVASAVLLCATLAAASPKTAVFLARDRLIEEHNARYDAGQAKFRMAHNKFSHMTKAELRRFTGELVEHGLGLASVLNSTNLRGIVDDLDGKIPPKSADYRHLCSPIRFQDTCGSCYAFSAAAAMEVHLRLKKNFYEDVSEQDIVDCSTATHGNKGCDGGNTIRSFKYIHENGFITKRSKYPYENQLGKCRSQRAFSAGTVGGSELVYGPRAEKENKMKVVVGLDGPVTVMLSYMPESFYHYDGGIYDDVTCGQFDPENLMGHAVAIVGYGSEGGEDYWIIRNSWGTDWGEKGYMRMAIGMDLCRITTKVVLPVVIK